MPRFYVPQPLIGPTLMVTDPEQLHHIRDVLRLKSGDTVTVFDGIGREATALIVSLNQMQALLEIQQSKPALPQNVRITIACAIPRQSRMDDIIDQLTQLGVDSIIPLQT